MTQQTVRTHDLIDLQLCLDWDSKQGRHKEIHHFSNFNIWRDLDLLPEGLQKEILHQQQGHSGTVVIPAGEIVPGYDPRLVHRVRTTDFNGIFQGREITPQLGRFYPQGMIEALPGVFSSSLLPLRIIAMDDDSLTCDLNHPLAKHDMSISSTIGEIHGAPDEHGGRCQDVLEQMLHGPGMQVRNNGQATDFFSADPFRRIDETSDSNFYAQSRMTDHLDARALSEVSELYGSLLTSGSRVLDLMASVNSHIPRGVQPTSVVGIGMNEDELAANPLLSERVLHDLNSETSLPFGDDSFDAVVCTVSLEYLIHPFEIFGEIKRILKPGGIFINTFSNRWFPPKVTALWIDLHEFERLGLVSEYYLRTGGFGPLNTRSLLGLSRPQDDRYGGQLTMSDPIYAVWAYKEQE